MKTIFHALIHAIHDPAHYGSYDGWFHRLLHRKKFIVRIHNLFTWCEHFDSCDSLLSLFSPSASSASSSTTNNEQVSTEVAGNTLSNSDQINLVLGPGTNIAPGGIQLSSPSDASIAAMGALSQQALGQAYSLAAAAESGSLQNAAAEQAAAENLANKATPANATSILTAVGGIIVVSLIAWGIIHHGKK